jgi:hypothetical protein
MLHVGDEIHLVFWLEVDHHNSTHAILILALQIPIMALQSLEVIQEIMDPFSVER